MDGFNARKLDLLIKKLLICMLYLPLQTKAQSYLPTIFWDPDSPALNRQYWSKVVDVRIFQTLTFLCPNNDINIVPYTASNTKSYYNLYVREVSPNDTDLDYNTVCDPQKSRYIFSCNQTRNTKIDFARPGRYRQFAMNTNQADHKDPIFERGMDHIFFSTSNGSQESLITKSTKCTMVFRIHFCNRDKPCARPMCATYGREEVCVPKSGLNDAPRNVTVTANTTSTLSISWKQPLNTDNVVAYYAICYRTNTSQACQTKMIESHVESASLENLNSSTQYFIRVRAVTCKGPGTYSTEISYKTQGLPATTTEPPKTTIQATTTTTRIATTARNDIFITAPPKKLTLTSKTSVSVTITWEAPDVGDVMYYSLCARVNNGSLSRDCITTLAEPTQLSAVVYGLKAETSYGIRIRAQNSKLPSNYSKELMVRTDVDQEPPSPQAQHGCSESTIHSVSLVVGIIIGAVVAIVLLAVVWILRAKKQEQPHQIQTLKHVTNRGFLSSVSGVNTIDKKNDKNLNCTMELNSLPQ